MGLSGAQAGHTPAPLLGAQDHLETVVAAGPRCSLCLLLDHSCPRKSFVPVMRVPDTASRCAQSWQGVSKQAAAPHGARCFNGAALLSVIPDILQEREWKARLWQVGLEPAWSVERGKCLCLHWMPGCPCKVTRWDDEPWVSPWCKTATDLGLPRRALFFALAILADFGGFLCSSAS